MSEIFLKLAIGIVMITLTGAALVISMAKDPINTVRAIRDFNYQL